MLLDPMQLTDIKFFSSFPEGEKNVFVFLGTFFFNLIVQSFTACSTNYKCPLICQTMHVH